MLFMIKYQTQKDAADPHSYFKRSFLAENPGIPTHEMIKKIVDYISSGDFDANSIEIEELIESNAKEMKKQWKRVHKFI